MSLKKEVLHRLLLAKSILTTARNSAPEQPNPHVVALDILNAHDAADLVFAAVADHQHKLPAKDKMPPMIGCLGLITTAADKYVGYFVQLNETRNSLKHTGNLPNTNQWAGVGADVFEKLSNICDATLGVSLEGVDESDLLISDEVKALLLAARLARDTEDFRAALAEVAKALFVAFDGHPNLWTVRTGEPKADDALKLTAFGISANDFLRLQEFLPRTSKLGDDPFQIFWRQSEFGHPGNWREDVADFCINCCLRVALNLQNAPSVPHAMEFQDLYDYRVTAKEDNVEVWEDVIDENLENATAYSFAPFRAHKRYLQKGAFIEVSAHTPNFISDDVSADGGWIKRVRVSESSGLAAIFPDARAEFVDLAKVQITCVPKLYMLERFPSLSEMPWERDPTATYPDPA
jgi:hypothetical protein